MHKLKRVLTSIIVATLVVLIASGTTSEIVKATTVTHSYSVIVGSPKTFGYQNPNVNSSISCNITAQPTSSNSHKVLVSVYDNPNCDGTPLATKNFVGGDPGGIMNITIPAGTKYYFKVSTTQNATVSGTLKIVH